MRSNKLILLFSIILISIGVSHAQQIQGSIIPTPGNVYAYSYTTGISITYPRWELDGQNVSNPTVNGSTYSVSITFSTPGDKTLAFLDGSNIIAQLIVSVQALLPSVPTPLDATDITSESFTANWSSVNGATSYRLDVSDNSSFSTFVQGYQNKTVTVTSSSVTGLSANTRYYYRIRAVNNAGVTQSSIWEDALTRLKAPVATAATGITSDSFWANWEPSSGATGYILDVASDDNFQEMVAEFTGLEVNGVTQQVTGLNNETRYHYRLRATGPTTSDYSNTIVANILDMNYIRTINVKVAGMTSQSQVENAAVTQATKSFAFFDGLGRPIQSIVVGGSPSGNDMVQPIAYDQYGRETKKYLPYTDSSTPAWYKAEALRGAGTTGTSEAHYRAGRQFAFYQEGGTLADDERPYAEVVFEKSPLNKPLRNYGAGEAWSSDGENRYVEHQQRVNTHGTTASAISEKVIAWIINDAGMPVRSGAVDGYVVVGGFYNSSQLMVYVTIDEEGNIVREYKDKSGRTVLKKVATTTAASQNLNSTTDWALTYYVYNEFDDLAYVFQPELSRKLHNGSNTYNVTSTDIANFGFQYKYDSRRRIAEKRVPGAGLVYMVYDNRDRLILTQDALQRVASPYRWTFTKYDELNRPVLTGIKDTTTLLSRNDMQQVVNDYYAAIDDGKPWRKLCETYVGDLQNNVYGYSNYAYPVVTTGEVLALSSYLTVNYYDSYTFKSLFGSGYDYENDGLAKTVSGYHYEQVAYETQVVGLVTGSRVKVLDGGPSGGQTWLKTVKYYDDKYRLIQTQSDNYKGGMDRVSNLYDFSGMLLDTRTTHSMNSLQWSDIRGLIVLGNKLTRSESGSGWGTVGAASVEMLPANTDGWVEFTAATSDKAVMVGFSTSNTNANWNTIRYALYLTAAVGLQVRENGGSASVLPAGHGYKVGDVFRIERSGAKIKYYQNGTLLLERPAIASALLVDLAFGTSGAEIFAFRSSFGTSATHTIDREFEYDHGERLTHTWHQIDEGEKVLLSKNEYNELGQVIDRKLHSTLGSGSDYKQSVDYRYNIRGWLTSINNSSLANDEITNDDDTDYFGMNLYYNEPDAAISSATLFNGNISATKWSNYGGGTVSEKAYTYGYDAMNRLLSSQYHAKTVGWSAYTNARFAETGFVYDLNGNIKNLMRNDGRESGLMDSLTYYYGTGTSLGNKLVYVRDDGDLNKGFVDGHPGSSTDYTYDVNGNLTRDVNKGIGTSYQDQSNLIRYNHLNLPEFIRKQGNTLRYVYDATGRKLSQNASYGYQIKQIDYVGEFVYENDLLQYISHEEGRVVLSSTKLVYANGGEDVNDFTESNATLEAITMKGGESYVSVKADGGGARTGVFPIGGAIPVSPGERYKIRLKGYRTGDDGAYMLIKVGGNDISWRGSAIPKFAMAEGWIDQIVVIPPGMTTLEAGIVWNTVTAGQVIYINEFEIIRLGSTDPEYQYHLKDHLGNVRLTFTTKDDVDESIATLENDRQEEESATYLRYDMVKRVKSMLFDHTRADSAGYAIRLNGSEDEQMGLARSLSVMPGDTVKARVFAKYVDPDNSNIGTFLTTFAAQMANPPAGMVVDGPALAGSGNVGLGIAPTNHSDETEAGPLAYINYIFINRDYDPASVVRLSEKITTAAAESGATANGVPHEELTIEEVIKEPGYVYIYLSNDHRAITGQQVDVFFDDFEVEHAKSKVIQIDDYYPFGLTFNSYQRENSIPQNFLYQEKEWEQDLGLNLYDFEWRQYDPFVVRTTTMDPHADSYPSLSPYSWAANNPLSIIDPDGRDIVSSAIATTYTGVDAQNYFRQLQSQSSSSSNSGDPGGRTFYSFNSRTQARREQAAKEEKDNQPGFWSGMGDGIVAGGKSTVDFVKSLGTVEGWENLAQGIATFGELASPLPSYAKMQLGLAATMYTQNVPNMSGYEMGYDLGYGTEKLAESILLSKGAGVATRFLNFSANGGYGVSMNLGRLGKFEFMYRNPSVRGGTLFSYKSAAGGKFRLDYHSFSSRGKTMHFHTNYWGYSVSPHRSLNPLRFGQPIK